MTIPDAVRPRRPRRSTLVTASAWLVAMLGLGFAILALRTSAESNHQLQLDRSAQATAIAQLSTALNQTRTQLQQHGIQPKAPPPATIVQGVPGATGAAGQSIVGAQGEPGRDGVSPDPKAVAALVYAMIHPVPGPKGDTGAPGKDSTVPGPQGAPGPASTVAGPAGKDGTNGTNGKDGTNGSNGEPPAGWTFTDGHGDTQDCERASNFDPSQPRYTCTITSTPSPPPSPSPSPTPTPSPSPTATASKQATVHRTSAPVSTGPGRP